MILHGCHGGWSTGQHEFSPLQKIGPRESDTTTEAEVPKDCLGSLPVETTEAELLPSFICSSSGIISNLEVIC